MEEELKYRIAKLEQEHQALDEQIQRAIDEKMPNQLALQRLKREKLRLKEEIEEVRRKLVPDIIA